MDNQRIEIDYYLAFAPRLRLLRLGERVLSYTFLGTFGSVCVFTWWLNPWIHLPSDWPRWASAWETFSSVWEFLKVFSVNSAIVGVAMTGAVTAMIWNVSFAQKMTNKMDALERRVRWAQRAQQASLSAEQENAAQSSREPQILQVTMPGGLPLDVWRLILARLPLRTISKVSTVSKLFARTAWSCLGEINAADILSIPPPQRGETVCRSLLLISPESADAQLAQLVLPDSQAFLLVEMLQRSAKFPHVTSLSFKGITQENHQGAIPPELLRTSLCSVIQLLEQPCWSRLQSLDLMNFSDSIALPDHGRALLRNLTSLTRLKASCILDSSSIMGLTRLKTLACRLSPAAPLSSALAEEAFHFPTSLKKLTVYFSTLGEWLQDLTHLSSLSLFISSSNAPSPAHIARSFSLLTNLQTLSLSPTNEFTLGLLHESRASLASLSRLNCDFPLDFSLNLNKLTRLDCATSNTDQWQDLLDACRARGCLNELKYIELPCDLLAFHGRQLWTHPVLFPNLDSIVMKWPVERRINTSLIKWIQARSAENVTPLKLFGANLTIELIACLEAHYGHSLKTLYASKSWSAEHHAADSLLPSIVRLTNLEHLHLNSTAITDEALEKFIPQLQHLRVLDLRTGAKFRKARSAKVIKKLWLMPSIDIIYQ